MRADVVEDRRSRDVPERLEPSQHALSLALGPLAEILLTRDAQEGIVDVPMARIRTAERTLQGRSLSSFGALACTPGHYLDHEDQPGRRELANAGRPVVRW